MESYESGPEGASFRSLQKHSFNKFRAVFAKIGAALICTSEFARFRVSIDELAESGGAAVSAPGSPWRRARPAMGYRLWLKVRPPGTWSVGMISIMPTLTCSGDSRANRAAPAMSAVVTDS